MSFFDTCVVEGEFLDRAVIVKSPLAFWKGGYRSAMRFALDEVDTARARGHHVGVSLEEVLHVSATVSVAEASP